MKFSSCKHHWLLSILLSILWITTTPYAWAQKHCFCDSYFREKVHKQLEKRKKQFPHGHLFDILKDKSLEADEIEALEFLYAYMPLADIANMPGSFYVDNVKASLQARNEMPWGKTIPEEIFRHFVLPIRVNNENLDESRALFFKLLKDRVSYRSMYEAALEVNHWCHEWVTYSPSDARTLSPLSTIRNLTGRCGEESTLTVAAMRSVGIPARQVYTPRWAHTDDNHAWVEVWIDGEWHFLGACEPAPVLNMSWFNSSVKRAMFVHTLVFGDYQGEEEVIQRTDLFTEINCTPLYAPVEKLEIEVVDERNRPVEGAKVSFCIYNYAEFFPIVTQDTDRKGKASVSTGKGDMMIWATHRGQVAFAISHPQSSPVRLQLHPQSELPDEHYFEINPPKNSSVFLDVSDMQIDRNNLALIVEDSIRRALQDTLFISHNEAKALAQKWNISPDEEVIRILKKSRGNYAQIAQFIEQTPACKRSDALRLLSVLTEKDWQDTPTNTLVEILKSTASCTDPFVWQYVFNPRIENEYISAYRTALRQTVSAKECKRFRQNPSLIVAWINKHIEIDDKYNNPRVTILPEAVRRTRRSDVRSARLFFVALARSLNIASRINPVTQAVEYTLDNGEHWISVEITATQQSNTAQQNYPVRIHFAPTDYMQNPSYYSHFSIAKIEDNATLSTLYYNENEDLSYKNRFTKPIQLSNGEYYLISGNRLASGKVSGRMKKFSPQTLVNDSVTLLFPHKEGEVSVLGSMNIEEHYQPAQTDVTKSILSTTGRGYFVLVILRTQEEPSNHLLKDLEKVSTALNEWGRPFLFLFPDAPQMQNFRSEEFPQLPQNSYWGIDNEGIIQKMISQSLELPLSSQLPWVIVADSFGRIVFIQQGYNIGTGEQLLSIFPHL